MSKHHLISVLYSLSLGVLIIIIAMLLLPQSTVAKPINNRAFYNSPHLNLPLVLSAPLILTITKPNLPLSLRPQNNPIIMSEDFEYLWPDPNSSWKVLGNPTWDDTSYNPASGAWSAWAARGGEHGVDPYNSNYLNNMYAWAIYGPFDLSQVSAAQLGFSYWSITETNYDWFYWMASTNGNNFFGPGRSGDSQGWQTKFLDLTNV